MSRNTSDIKICIVGISGSGKTTLARRLARELTIPRTDLDKIRYPSPNTVRPTAELKTIIAHLANEPTWIVEGSYAVEMKPLFATADYIIWLDIGAIHSAYRILKRHIIHSIQGRRKYPHRTTPRLIWQALRSAQPVNSVQTRMPWRQEIINALTLYNSKVVKISTTRAAKALRGRDII